MSPVKALDRISFCSLLFTCLLAACSSAGAAPASSLQRGEIERLLRQIDQAIADHDAKGVLAAYDPNESALIEHMRGALEGWFSLHELLVAHRLGSLTIDGATAEAVVFEDKQYEEYGRDKVDQSWLTIHLKSAGESWKITSQAERVYARCASTALAVELMPEEGLLRGSCTMRVEITAAGEDSLLLELNRGLAISSITDGQGHPVPFERNATAVAIAEPHPLAVGDARTLEIAFEGKLFNESKEQSFSQVSIAPGGSFASWVTHWYPRLEGVAAKSTGTISYVVPEGVTVASSGRLARREALGAREKFEFSVDRPLQFSFAAAHYFHREQTPEGMQLGVYLLRGGDAKADLYLEQCARTLRHERKLYGGYPFDGYAVVELPSEETGVLGGSSEQGMNFFPVGVLPDDTFPLLLLAHEMGHSWWGNLIASGDGAIIDEGLAQASAVLCLREFEGEKALRSFLQRGLPYYHQSAREYFARFASNGGKDYPLGVAGAGSAASSALHDLADTKGEFVYCMLIDKIGEEAFVRGLRAIVGEFGGSSVSLSDLKNAWERASGMKLTAFFEQWFHRTGAPELELRSKTESLSGEFVTSGTIVQKGEPYDVDVEIVAICAGQRRVERVAASGASTPFSFRTSARPELVVLDPDYKILRWTDVIRNSRLLADADSIRSMGRIADATAKLEEYVVKAPDGLGGRYRLGLCRQDSGELDRAEECFRFVLDRFALLDVYEPAVSSSQLHLAQVYDLSGRREEAKRAYEKTLALPDESSSHAAARSGLAAAYQKKPRAEPPGSDELVRYAGQYDDGQGLTVRVAVNSQGILTAAQPGKPEGALEWSEGSRFRVAGNRDVAFEFVGQGKDISLDIMAGANVMHLKRVP